MNSAYATTLNATHAEPDWDTRAPNDNTPASWYFELLAARSDGMLPSLGFSPVFYDDGITESWKRTDANGLVLYVTYEQANRARCAVNLTWMYVNESVGVPSTVRVTEKLWRALMDGHDNSSLSALSLREDYQ